MDQSPIFSNLTSIYLGWLVSCLRSPSAADQAGGAAWSFSEPIHPTPPPLLYYTTPPTSTTPPLLSTVPPFLYDILHSLVHCPPLSTISPQCSTLIPSTHYYKAPTLSCLILSQFPTFTSASQSQISKSLPPSDLHWTISVFHLQSSSENWTLAPQCTEPFAKVDLSVSLSKKLPKKWNDEKGAV